MSNEKNIYQENGYEDRMDYLGNLSDTYGVDLSIVVELSDLLGEGEDFDGLVSQLADMEGGF